MSADARIEITFFHSIDCVEAISLALERTTNKGEQVSVLSTLSTDTTKPYVMPIIATGIGVLFVFLALYVFTTSVSIEQTALRLPYQDDVKPLFRVFLIQGWAFFTKDPQDEEILIYSLENGSWENVNRDPPSALSNFIGLSRFTRAVNVEAGMLTSSLDAKMFKDCRSSFEVCVTSNKIREVENLSTFPILCGSIGIVLQKPLPWAWRNFEINTDRPSRMVRLQVKCTA